jgi:predicted dehydrogenase
MKKKVNIGVIGGGMISRAHIDNFCKDKRSQVTWVADISSDVLKKIQNDFQIPQATSDYRKMLKDKNLDAIVICTPPVTHYKMAVDALRAGKHLMLEKPCVMNPAEGKKLVQEAKKHKNLILNECSCRHARLQPKFKFIKNFIDSGKLGKVYCIHHLATARQRRCGIEYNPPAKWFIDRSKAGGGVMYDWGVYDLSFHLGIMSDKPNLKEVNSFCINGLDKVDPGTPVFDTEEHGGAWMQFDTGLNYIWERGSNAHNEQLNQTKIYGTKGGLKFTYTSFKGKHEVEYYWIDKEGKGRPRSEIFEVDMSKHKGDMPALGKNFVDSLVKKSPVGMPIEIAVKHIDIIHEIYKAARW